MNRLNDAAEVVDRNAHLLRERSNAFAQLIDLAHFGRGELLPLLRQQADLVHPVGLELLTEIVVEEVLTADAMQVSQTHQLAFKLDETLVDLVQLLDQRFDTRIVEVQRLQVLDDVGDDLVVFLEVLRGEDLALDLPLDQTLLQLAIAHEVLANAVEDLGDAFAQLGFHRRHRHRAAVVEFVFE